MRHPVALDEMEKIFRPGARGEHPPSTAEHGALQARTRERQIARDELGNAGRASRELEYRGVGRVDPELAQHLDRLFRTSRDQLSERQKARWSLAEHDAEPD